jgi:hypothetical protein
MDCQPENEQDTKLLIKKVSFPCLYATTNTRRNNAYQDALKVDDCSVVVQVVTKDGGS